VTTVFVTHDQQEALALADRSAIMEGGVCRQVGRPEDVYNQPADAFVAQFLGKANLLPGSLVGLTDDVVVMVRPENIIIRPSPAASPVLPLGEGGRRPGESRKFDVMVVKATFEGALLHYVLDLNGTSLTARYFHHGQKYFQPGDSVTISIPSDRLHILPKP
jgi:ABC-type Fe3+/spermidine/putrescine transport system ATPase subunit